MGKYCLGQNFAKAQIGEALAVKKFTHTTAVVNEKGIPVCIPHEDCMLEVLSVAPELASHPVLGTLKPGQSVQYKIENSGKYGERDIITTKTGKTADLKDLAGSTFQITGEKHP